MNTNKNFLMCFLCMLCIVQCKERGVPGSSIGNADGPFSLKSSTPDWKMEMIWEPNSLSRKIRFAKGNEKIGAWFNVDLQNRRAPFRFAEGSVDFTTMGKYQPSATVLLEGHEWSVTICHENADFVSQNAFVDYLQWESNRKHGVYALDKDGLMVACRIQDDTNGRSFNLEVFSITIAGKKPSESLITSYMKGNILLSRK